MSSTSTVRTGFRRSARHPGPRLRHLALAALLLVGSSACGGGDEVPDEAAPTTPSTTATSSGSTTSTSATPGLPTAEPSPTVTATYTSGSLAVSPSPEALPEFDWLDPQPLGFGAWTFRDCDSGPAERVCADGPGGAGGVISVTSAAVSSDPQVAAARARGDAAALRARADRFLAQVRSDRRARCGPSYSVNPSRTEVLESRGTPVVRYGFTAGVGDDPAEAQYQFAALAGDDLVLLDVVARDPGGCLPAGPEQFTSTELGSVLPLVDAMVRVTQFPRL